MRSINAENVAKEVIRRVSKGEKVVMGSILENLGYADSIVKNPQEVTKGVAYKAVMKPFAERLEKEIARIQTAMEKKDLDIEEYKVLTDAIDKLNKNYQLATGGATDMHKLTVTFDEAFKERI